MARPGATVSINNGHLGIVAAGDFGTPVLVLAIPAAPTAGFSNAFSVKSKAQVAAAFSNVANAAVIDAINNYFYAEAAEGTELFIVCVINTNQLNALAVDAIAGKALDLANGKARIVAFVKFPDVSYVSTPVTGFDADVHLCVTAAQVMADAWLLKRKPFRALVQGYGFVSTATALDYSTNTKRNVAIIVGALNDSTQAATLLALGRASDERPERNIGRVKSGSLVIGDTVTVKLGSVLLSQTPSVDLDTLHAKRYIVFEINENAPGYIFNDDNMLTTLTDDYNNLRYGRVIDNAVRIAYASYYQELKDDVDVDDNGRLAQVVIKALETKIETAIDAAMRAQLSKNKNGSAAIFCSVNPDPTLFPGMYATNSITAPNLNILTNGGNIYVFISMRPKGCLKYINIFLALTATT